MKYFFVIMYIYVGIITSLLFDIEQMDKCKNRSLFITPLIIGVGWPITLPLLISDFNRVSCP